jgi:gamma-glutamylcyclotransferase (GGCT)/AIG2-like uncharacterized protein YtfP
LSASGSVDGVLLYIQPDMLLLPGDYPNIVDGMVFEITDEVLTRADEYEAEEYKRVLVPKISRRKIWVYIQADQDSMSR